MKLLYSATAVLFLALSFLTANLSNAAFRAHYIESKLADWGVVGYLEDEREWQTVYNANQQLYAKFPSNPRHIRNRTRLLEWRSFLQRLFPDYAKKSSEKALQGHLVLSRLVPSLGYSWAGIAELRANQGLFDEHTYKALQNAVMLNPVEDLTQRRVIQTGMKHWDEWPDESRQLVKTTIENALRVDTTMQRYPITSFVYDAALSLEWEDELQPFLVNEKRTMNFENRKHHRKLRSRIN